MSIQDEPGRHVTPDGRIEYSWPPEGRYAALWSRIDAVLTDDEKHHAIALLHRWRDDTSTLVAYTDENGEWVDVEPDWTIPDGWLP